MGEGIVAWIVGPQLIGVVFIMIGWIQKNWPPKKINNYYGYRSDTAKKSQEAWDEGNRYAALHLMKAGVVCLIAGLVISTAFYYLPISGNVRGALTYLTILFAIMGSVITMMVKTESHLEKTFDKKNTA